jgi:hypothetical protein
LKDASKTQYSGQFTGTIQNKDVSMTCVGTFSFLDYAIKPAKRWYGFTKGGVNRGGRVITERHHDISDLLCYWHVNLLVKNQTSGLP